jgi:hypothetical protein
MVMHLTLGRAPGAGPPGRQPASAVLLLGGARFAFSAYLNYRRKQMHTLRVCHKDGMAAASRTPPQIKQDLYQRNETSCSIEHAMPLEVLDRSNIKAGNR